MTHAVFYFGSDPVTAERVRLAAASEWGAVTAVQRGQLLLLLPDADCGLSFAETDAAVGAVTGYVRAGTSHPGLDQSRHHNERFVPHVTDGRNWPLDDTWTGIFSAVVCTKQAPQELVLCNDVLGTIPFYFAEVPGGVIGGTTYQVLSRCLECEVDVVGLLQMMTPPFCSYGRRTLLRPLSRLLPGEWIKWDSSGLRTSTKFDDTLFDAPLEGSLTDMADEVWRCLALETKLAVGERQRVYVGMSGGWDSRVVLGALAGDGHDIQCLTYGKASLYESQIARRCAEAAGATHTSFDLERQYFPSRAEYERFIRTTESLVYLVWYPVLAGMPSNGSKPILLIGEHCEALDARNMLAHSSRSARRWSFLRGLAGRPDTFARTTPESFARWSDRIAADMSRKVSKRLPRLSPALSAGWTRERAEAETRSDIAVSMARIARKLPPFDAQLDEVFGYYHRVRYLAYSQNLLLGSQFRVFAPVNSMRAVRLLSRVHPRFRTRRRLMDAIARLPAFDRLARIPSAQIPGLSARAPAWLREIVWAARSTVDEKMLARAVKARDAKRRQRILPSLDYAAEYRRPETAPAVRSWFSGRWIEAGMYVDLAASRGDLTSWPFINLDIGAAANASLILDCCRLPVPPAGPRA